MAGLAMICKIYGGMIVKGADGKEVKWLYDYAQDRPRLESEMLAEEKAAKERRKQLKAKATIDKEKQLGLF